MWREAVEGRAAWGGRGAGHPTAWRGGAAQACGEIRRSAGEPQSCGARRAREAGHPLACARANRGPTSTREPAAKPPRSLIARSVSLRTFSIINFSSSSAFSRSILSSTICKGEKEKKMRVWLRVECHPFPFPPRPAPAPCTHLDGLLDLGLDLRLDVANLSLILKRKGKGVRKREEGCERRGRGERGGALESLRPAVCVSGIPWSRSGRRPACQI